MTNDTQAISKRENQPKSAIHGVVGINNDCYGFNGRQNVVIMTLVRSLVSRKLMKESREVSTVLMESR